MAIPADFTEEDLARLWAAADTELWEQAALDWRRLVAAEYAPRLGVERTASVLGYTVSRSKGGVTSSAQKLATAGRKLRKAAEAGDAESLARVARAEALGGLLTCAPTGGGQPGVTV